ncbi:MAG TPA: NAD(P)-dependent oxidoreductase [Acidisphaera sp.]|nr:NAD(P)-dependent oxidoreductase [Acidisphaera sp.]
MATNRTVVLIPDTMDGAGADLLRARADLEVRTCSPGLTGEELRPLLSDVAAVALSVTPLRESEIAAAPALRVVARLGVGYDAVDVPTLTLRGIPLMTTGTANSTSVAEAALSALLALAKRHLTLDRLVREGRWAERASYLPAEVAARTVLVVGFGRIGARMARRCVALEMRTLVYDPHVAQAPIGAMGAIAVRDLDAALPDADYVTLHCPKTAETTGLMDARRIALMKTGAMLINTARGGIVDERALFDALSSDHLAGAGLDVFALEPADPGHPLLRLDTVLCAPHLAGVTVESTAAMAATAARNILSVLDGTPDVANVVNWSIYE